ncbi:MAG: ATP-binding cassette domain-containing protein [Acidobacteria bacterium]|nr:ATP-binding cassette domain-containing protein [Acidobacteriota bacterium]
MRGRRTVLNSITLSISLGEQVAIVGPNGSGKSSLIKTIMRELHPLQTVDDWSLKILGKDRWNIFHLRPQLGIVSPDWVETCTRPITATEAVMSGFFSSAEVWPHNEVTEAMTRKVAQVMVELEIDHLADHDMSEMSSGESRRVVIARALVHGPKALILDEPSASLDMRAVDELRETLRKVAQSGVSIILVTHHLPDIIPEITRVVLMKDGHVFRDGAKHEVLSSDSLSSLFDMDLEVFERNGYFHLI